MSNYVIFNEKSSLDYDLLIESISSMPRPKKRFNEIVVEGRDGTLTTTDDTYEPYLFTQEFILTDMAKLANIKAFFSGSGKLITSENPERFYNVSIFDSVTVNYVTWNWRKFVVSFYCQPFCYEITQQKITLIASDTLINLGDVEAKPIIKVYGTGDITLTINGQSFTVKNVTANAVIDCQSLLAYEGTAPKLTVGDFPILKTDENIISFSGATQIEITPNWRWF